MARRSSPTLDRMWPWLLLILTGACAALTVDAFRFGGPMKEPSDRFWPREWKRGQDHLPLVEQERNYRLMRYPLLGTAALAWIFLAMTILLAILTVEAFLA